MGKGERVTLFPMRRFSLLLVALASVCSAQPTDSAGDWPHRTYSCAQLDSPPAIDGDPSEWAAGRWTEPFIDIEGEAKPAPRYLTRAAMAWDEAHFYIAAEMIEPHLWGTLAERDSVLHRQNNFEVFIDPDGDGAMYHELQVNVLNTVFDLLLVKRYRHGGPAQHGWNTEGLQSAVKLDGTPNDPSDVDRGWSVEIAIPWSALAETAGVVCPPESGDVWRVNFSRVEWTTVPTANGYAKAKHPETGRRLPEDNWVWSPQARIDMHEPQYWGFVEFLPTEATSQAGPVQPAATDSQ